MGDITARRSAALALSRRAHNLTQLAGHYDEAALEHALTGDHLWTARAHRFTARNLRGINRMVATVQKGHKDVDIEGGPTPVLRPVLPIDRRRDSAAKAHDLAAEAHEQLDRESRGGGS